MKFLISWNCLYYYNSCLLKKLDKFMIMGMLVIFCVYFYYVYVFLGINKRKELNNINNVYR